jgi:peptidyl-tRNA hydrolase, PTH1 family
METIEEVAQEADKTVIAPREIRKKLIVGLGNPGAQYHQTRHNIGFDLIDSLAHAHKISVTKRDSRALVGEGKIGETPVLLVKPQTYMNSSGEAVAALAKKHEIGLQDILVLVDDIHVEVGKIRLRMKGSSGGQNGLKSIAYCLETEEWARVRIGVDKPPPGLQIDWVLSRFSPSDRQIIEDTLILAMGAVEVWVNEGILTAMNRFNTK